MAKKEVEVKGAEKAGMAKGGKAAKAKASEDTQDVVLFSNSRSGGGKGKKVLVALAPILGADRVFDLGENPHPEKILAREDLVLAAARPGGLRLIVCGGDGTMTWIMAAVDTVKDDLRLGAAHRFEVAMMPLGTGNDLARTFGWGGAFRSACLKPSWVAAARAAAPAKLDRWLVCVMPAADGQRAGAPLLDVPEVFSAHEFVSRAEGGDATAPPKSKHSVLRAGRHHSRRMTAQSVANLVQHDAEMRDPDSGGGGGGDAASPPRSEATSVDSLASDAFEAPAAEAGGDAAAALMANHVRPSESVLRLGGTWRSYDGTFSNYFSVGVDAAGAHAFHSARRENPKRFSSRAKNQLLYAWLGACATGGACGCAGPPPRLAGVSRLLARVAGETGWREVPLPRGCRGLIVLNLRSYAGGRNLWGPRSLCRDTALCRASKQDAANAVDDPRVDDGILEVVTADDVFSMGATLMTTNGLGGRARRLVRAKELRITTKEALFMQIDGEPWLQPAATVHLKCFGQSTVLTRAK